MDLQVLDDSLLDRYLHRIGWAHPDDAGLAADPDIEMLRSLHVAHLLTVPFENLSIHMGEPIVLDPDLLLAKVVDRGRGGFCYELNTCFATLLTRLGFDVTMLEGRVYDDGTADRAFDHMTLRVDLDVSYLVDVGFGSSFEEPLRLFTRGAQNDPRGRFSIEDRDDGWLDLVRGDSPQYRFSLEPRVLTDYEGCCDYHQTSADSPFTKSTVCSLMLTDGRVSIGGRRLVHTTPEGKTERTVHDDAELLDLYRQQFGIELDQVPG
jgi:N-hydroxyarylamine O-acetyltransferase